MSCLKSANPKAIAKSEENEKKRGCGDSREETRIKRELAGDISIVQYVKAYNRYFSVYNSTFSFPFPEDFDILFCARDKGMKKGGAVMFKTIKDEGVKMSGEEIESKIRGFKS